MRLLDRVRHDTAFTRTALLRLSFGALLAVLAPASAHAASSDPVMQAMKERQQAYGQYYRAVRNSKDKSRANRERLRQQIVEPANTKFSRVTVDRQEKSLDRVLAHAGQKAAQNNRANGKKNDKKNDKNKGGPSGRTKGGTGGTGGGTKPRSEGLDGSGLEKELDFVPKKKPPAPKKPGVHGG